MIKKKIVFIITKNSTFILRGEDINPFFLLWKKYISNLVHTTRSGITFIRYAQSGITFIRYAQSGITFIRYVQSGMFFNIFLSTKKFLQKHCFGLDLLFRAFDAFFKPYCPCTYIYLNILVETYINYWNIIYIMKADFTTSKIDKI